MLKCMQKRFYLHLIGAFEKVKINSDRFFTLGNSSRVESCARPFKFPLRSILGVLGALLLVAMFRRCGPWHMCYIPLHSGSENFVEFRHIPFIGNLHIAYYYFIVLSLIVLPAMVFLFRSGREAVVHLFRNKPALWGLVISLCFFLITFFLWFFSPGNQIP